MDQIYLQQAKWADNDLVHAILGGHNYLFEHIIRRYNQRLFRIGMSILNDDLQTEEAMQVAYINAYEHLFQFENRSAFGTWLTRIMLNECLAMKRKQHQFISTLEKQMSNNIEKKSPAVLLVNKELNMILEQAITNLPEKYRLVFVLREIEDMSIRETSEVLSIEEPNVKVRLNRAKAMLRKSLDGYVKDNVYGFHLRRCDKMVNAVLSSLSF